MQFTYSVVFVVFRCITTTINSCFLSSFFQEEQLAFLVFLLIVTVIGNSVVLVAVSVAKHRSRMTFFIMHLAIAGKKQFYI
jgi:hypothetical protein